MKKLLITLLGFFAFSGISWASGGTCPSAAAYLNDSNPTGSLITLSAKGVTSCFFVASTGADTNTGTDEAHPLLHAPGMAACSNNCTGSAGAGIGFIFRGGDTWHRSSGTPATGAWVFPTNGSGGSPVYLGVDQTWDNSSVCGGSWCRPIFNMDNALNTSPVASCTFDDGAASPLTLLSVSGRSNLIVDNLEFTGGCSSSTGNGQYVQSGTSVIMENMYFHGWTVTTGATDDTFRMISGGGGTGNRYLFIVMDGQDSSYGTVCTTSSCVASTWSGSGSGNAASGWGMTDCYDVEYSIFRHLSNALECGNVGIYHDDLFEYIFAPIPSSRHGNVVESLNPTSSSLVFYFYNNVVRDINNGVGVWPEAFTAYIFNNVFENDQHFPPDPNCLMMSPTTNGQTGASFFVYNNTFDATCGSHAVAQSPFFGSGSSFVFANNHVLGRTGIFSGSALWQCGAGNTCTTKTDSGGEVFQTTAVANGQGYTLANDYSPTNVSNSTVGAGLNESASCSTFSSDSALCSGTSNGVSEQSGSGGKIAVYPTITVNLRGTTFDSGAYQFAASGQASPPSCSPGSGTYSANQTVTCTNPNSGTTVICYSTSTTPATNGSGTGCTTGTQYTTALTVSANETLNVIAGTSTLTDSSVVTYSYVLQGGAPVCSPVGGTYIGTQSVSLSQPQSLAIGYTTNGTSPVSNGSGGCSGSCTLYSGAISVASSETIKSIGMASGWTDSSIASCAYVINAPAATDMTMKGVTSSQGVTIVQ